MDLPCRSSVQIVCVDRSPGSFSQSFGYIFRYLAGKWPRNGVRRPTIRHGRPFRGRGISLRPLTSDWSDGEHVAAVIRLLLLGDPTLFRAMPNHAAGAEFDFRIVSHFPSAHEALDWLGGQPFDLILFDCDPDYEQNGIRFVRSAREAGYAGRIFIVTTGMNDADYVRALGLGVCGIFLKHNPPELLMEALHRVMAGETWIDPNCIRGLITAVEAQSRRLRGNRLSDRERDVLDGVLAGSSTREIAVRLRISEASVKSALQQLFVKTGVRKRSQLVRVALEDYGAAWGLRG